MTQFKEKSAKQAGFVSAGLFTYPALQAADILLYDTDQVPVGDDQRQHLELTRDLAIRFNRRYGDTFVVPEAVIPQAGARVMDLQEPTAKMSKSVDSAAGHDLLLDDPAAIEQEVQAGGHRHRGRGPLRPGRAKPGVSNLLSILAAATGRSPEEVAAGYTQYGPLKADTGEAVVELLRPIQARYRELVADPGELAAPPGQGRRQGPRRGRRRRWPGPTTPSACCPPADP